MPHPYLCAPAHGNGWKTPPCGQRNGLLRASRGSVIKSLVMYLCPCLATTPYISFGFGLRWLTSIPRAHYIIRNLTYYFANLAVSHFLIFPRFYLSLLSNPSLSVDINDKRSRSDTFCSPFPPTRSEFAAPSRLSALLRQCLGKLSAFLGNFKDVANRLSAQQSSNPFLKHIYILFGCLLKSSSQTWVGFFCELQ
jgi:hypothetical protein